MTPAPFEYARPRTVEEAVSLLVRHGEEAKLLAGGHSLLPLMKLRVATPSVLVDIGRLVDLRYVRDAGDHIAIGALARHHDLETSPLLEREAPLVRYAAGFVGDPQVRHRGTIGGSLAHADPAADLPAVIVALEATMVVYGPRGERLIPARDFFRSAFEPALAPDEVLVEVRVPRAGGRRWAFQKFNRRSIDWAIVGVAVVEADGGAKVALVNMGPTPLRAVETEAALRGGAGPAEAAALADRGTEPPSDLNASAEYRRHLARVLVRRALERIRR
ncbi:MAG TPA: xanthine dehydrogenase family protein subunit M [Candidatus Dormibacteraeota bacterium]|jgi:carbon-monoxide dehydrogenase medium subunit|nr:xanthine dehydrogenase family protein subunit M [Candidatus Dormibacteraeota bacterium]